MTKPSAPPHLPQLDALRAFAVLSVLAYHWVPELKDVFVAGRYGVRLFFVISGFLITNILLRLRQSTHSGEQSFAFSLRQFYLRRFLRIFPLFYAVLIGTALLGVPRVREQFIWHLLYLSNVLFAIEGYSGYASHFWSLAVEEQFYLIWPAIVLLMPRRILKPALTAMVAVGPAWRIIGSLAGVRSEAAWLPVFACFDSLALGALLAVTWEDRNQYIFVKKCLAFGAALAVIAGFANMADVLSPLHSGISDLAASLLFVWLIHAAAQGFGGFVGFVLNLAALRYIGKISYGVYVYHFFIPYCLALIGLKSFLDSVPWTLNVVVFTATTIAVSAVSWHFFESPINNLKRFVPYARLRGQLNSEAGVSAPSAVAVNQA